MDALFETEQFTFDQTIYLPISLCFLSTLALKDLTDFASIDSDGSAFHAFTILFVKKLNLENMHEISLSQFFDCALESI